MYEVIYLISPPRSGSSAFMRMIEERGDLTVLHEPAVPAHDRARYGRGETAGWYGDAAPDTFAEVAERVTAAAASRAVFVKEMSFALAAMLAAEPAFGELVARRATFLLRSPHATIVSFYKRLSAATGELPVDAAEFAYLCGFDAAVELWRTLGALRGEPPLVMSTERLGAEPGAVVAGFCRRVGIAEDLAALSWSPQSAEYAARTWTDAKPPQQMAHWHGDALASTGFRPVPGYEVDASLVPTFAEIEDPRGREVCAAVLAAAAPHFAEMTGGAGVGV